MRIGDAENAAEIMQVASLDLEKDRHAFVVIQCRLCKSLSYGVDMAVRIIASNRSIIVINDYLSTDFFIVTPLPLNTLWYTIFVTMMNRLLCYGGDVVIPLA